MQFVMALTIWRPPIAPPRTPGASNPPGQDPVRSRLEGSQRDRTVLSGLACDAVLIPVARWPVVRVALRDVMAGIVCPRRVLHHCRDRAPTTALVQNSA